MPLVLFAALPFVLLGVTPSPSSNSTFDSSSFTLRGLRLFFEAVLGFDAAARSMRLVNGALRRGSWFVVGLGGANGVLVPLPAGPALPTPLPIPENIRLNSGLMPGSLAGPLVLACAPCTACGRGEKRPVRLLLSMSWASALRPFVVMSSLFCGGSGISISMGSELSANFTGGPGYFGGC